MDRENYLKAVRFEQPDYIPITFVINDSCWHHYPQEALFELIEQHPLLFPDYKRPMVPYVPDYANVARANSPFTDDFGCVWETSDNGITGTVTKHPLSDWKFFDSYTFPDPDKCMGIGPMDWSQEKKRLQRMKDNHQPVIGGLRHGHTFLQLCDIRGYENLMFDFADAEPRLSHLLEGVEAFNAAIVKKYVDMDVDVISYPEDLGMQVGPMLSPKHFIKYIQPSYKRLMALARDKGMIVHMHSDGDIRLLADDLVDDGVQILNLQDLVNGVDWIAQRFRGRVCIELDIDRQNITPLGSVKDIDRLIREEVSTLGCKAGGLMLIYGLYPNVPLENVGAVMEAMERYSTYYS